jgi:hypothetical protein
VRCVASFDRGALYRPERRGPARPETRRGGGPGGVASSLRSRRSRSRAGRVLGRPRGPVGLLWRLPDGRHRAGQWVTGRGSWVFSPLLLLLPWLGSGQRGLESIEVRPESMAAVPGRARTVQLQ